MNLNSRKTGTPKPKLTSRISAARMDLGRQNGSQRNGIATHAEFDAISGVRVWKP